MQCASSILVPHVAQRHNSHGIDLGTMAQPTKAVLSRSPVLKGRDQIHDLTSLYHVSKKPHDRPRAMWCWVNMASILTRYMISISFHTRSLRNGSNCELRGISFLSPQLKEAYIALITIGLLDWSSPCCTPLVQVFTSHLGVHGDAQHSETRRGSQCLWMSDNKVKKVFWGVAARVDIVPSL